MPRRLPITSRMNAGVSRGLLAIAVAGGLLAALLPGDQASAHVSIDVGDGEYVMEIGFRDEPAYVGVPNAVYVHVEQYGTGGTEPVEGLASTLTAEVSKDGQTFSPPLVPMDAGSYQAIFVPTQPGDYTFRISGTIGEAPIDESVTSSPTTFDSVQPLSAITFPPAQPDAASQAAQAEAASARTFGIAGIVLGALGLLVGAFVLMRSGRGAAVAAEPSRPIDPSGKLIK